MTEKYVLRVEGWNQTDLCPVYGQYLKWYDPYADAWSGKQNVMEFTSDIDEAKTFDSMREAAAYWHQPLLDEHNVPRQRKDAPGATGTERGAERPLTAFSMVAMPEADARKYEAAGARRLLDAIFGKETPNDDDPTQASAERQAGEGDQDQAGSDASRTRH